MATENHWDHAFHLTVPDHWMNDPQRPVRVGGEYQYYYLYNADYPAPTGTAWRLATTTDGMRFTDRGVKLSKHTQPNGDLWSGCLVVDETGSAGLGRGALIALVTQPDRVAGNGAQAQFLWYSTDGGRTFTNLSDTPVMPNPGREDFRDPKVERDGDRWLCVLAEGHELGLYTSDDLRVWHELSRFREDRYGTLECPDLFVMTADDGTSHWVLAASGNVSGDDRPGTYGYWVGSFDGTTFRPHSPDPRWLDHGFDWYAAVTWPVHDDAGAPTTDRRWAIGWMNNWAYANDTPPTWTDAGYHGIDSVVRELALVREGGGYRLLSRPLREPAGEPAPVVAAPGEVIAVPEALSVTARVEPGEEPAALRVKCSADGARYVEVSVSEAHITVDRSRSGCPGDGSLAVARAPWRGGATEIEVLVDRATVEVFADGGRVALSMLAFAPVEDTGLAVVDPAGAVSHLRAARVRATATETDATETGGRA